MWFTYYEEYIVLCSKIILYLLQDGYSFRSFRGCQLQALLQWTSDQRILVLRRLPIFVCALFKGMASSRITVDDRNHA